MDQDWNSLKPGTDYQWRLKFTDTKGTATTTDDQIHLGPAQTFRTTGTAPPPGAGGPPPGAGNGGTGGNGQMPGNTPPPADNGPKDPGGQTPGDQNPGNDNQTPPEQHQEQVVPRDTQAPSLTATAGRVKLADVIKKGLKVTATCSEACTVRAQLRLDAKTAKKLKLARRTVTIGDGTTVGNGKLAVPVKLTAKAKKVLKKARSLKATLVVTATDASGDASAPTSKAVTFQAVSVGRRRWLAPSRRSFESGSCQRRNRPPVANPPTSPLRWTPWPGNEHFREGL